MHDFLNYKYYFINKLDTNLIEKVDKNTVIIYRNYKSEIPSKVKILSFRTKEIQRIDKIVISSIFKKNKNYLNLNRFNLLSKLTKLDVIALGGISKSNIKKLNLVNCIGFAGISFFE